MNTKGIVPLVALVLIAGLSITSTAAAESHDYDFLVDQSQSNLTLYLYVDLGFPFGDDDDSESSPVSGTVEATLTPPFGDFTDIHITQLALDLVNNPSLSLLAGLVTADGNNLGLRMGDGHGSAGPQTAVASGSFNQTGNFVQGVGTVSYDYPFGSGTLDLSVEAPSAADLAGTVSDTASLITLTVPIDMTVPLEGITGYGRIYGTIVAQADTFLPRPGDVTGDNFVGGDDLTVILTNWGLSGMTRLQGDLTGEGFVGGDDYSEVLTYWGTGTPPQSLTTPMPEPATLGLMILGCLATLRRQRYASVKP